MCFLFLQSINRQARASARLSSHMRSISRVNTCLPHAASDPAMTQLPERVTGGRGSCAQVHRKSGRLFLCDASAVTCVIVGVFLLCLIYVRVSADVFSAC